MSAAAAAVRARPAVERHFEDNFVFELPESALARRGSILRLRVARGRATLTYKGLVPESATSFAKVREELETEVERPEILAEILERLGMRRTFRYQKYRTVYEIEDDEGSALLMRDETPMGGFLEIEGEERTVERFAGLLGFAREEYVRQSYIALQVERCRARGAALEDLIFADTPAGVAPSDSDTTNPAPPDFDTHSGNP